MFNCNRLEVQSIESDGAVCVTDERHCFFPDAGMKGLSQSAAHLCLSVGDSLKDVVQQSGCSRLKPERNQFIPKRGQTIRASNGLIFS